MDTDQHRNLNKFIYRLKEISTMLNAKRIEFISRKTVSNRNCRNNEIETINLEKDDEIDQIVIPYNYNENIDYEQQYVKDTNPFSDFSMKLNTIKLENINCSLGFFNAIITNPHQESVFGDFQSCCFPIFGKAFNHHHFENLFNILKNDEQTNYFLDSLQSVGILLL